MLTLFLGAEMEQRVAKHRNAEHVVWSAQRHPGSGQLLGHHQLIDLAQTGATVLLGPGHGQPSSLVQLGAPRRSKLRVFGAVQRADLLPIGGEVIGQKGADVQSECFSLLVGKGNP